ncbi:hypothetical protein G7Y89_g3567 [Cudoniella acicularis]|uniref:BTB domain-containing protein n=1 Tax=Cudoniella acicularis TaxID=354080 RepID=A0A8H4W896_9HELO|nr:hypothetical protein G7Y89_g3567 [Cudoniella acicularis]
MNAQLAPFADSRRGLYANISSPHRRDIRGPYPEWDRMMGMPPMSNPYIDARRRRQPHAGDSYLNATLACPHPWRDMPLRDPLSPGLVPTRRMPLSRPPYYDDHAHYSHPHSQPYDCCSGQKYSRPLPQHSHHHHELTYPCCSGSSSSSKEKEKDSSSSSSSNSNNKSDFDFKTKDISVRGKVYTVRASYLSEAPKFEADLVKYMDKKKEEVLPSRVLEMLISFINRETYKNNSPLDEVTLNILAHNVGAKSVVEYSLGRLKMDEVGTQEMTDIVAAILCSDKVAEGLKEWLKKHLGDREREWKLMGSRSWTGLVFDHPEVEARLQVLLGIRRKEEEGDYRIL